MAMITVDQRATFRAVLYMGSQRKIKFGTTDQVAVSASGVPLWQCDLAVSYFTEPGQRGGVEGLTVTVAASDDPFGELDTGQPVIFDRLSCGVSAAETGDNGRVRGGKLYWSGSGVRAANGTK